MDAKNNVFKHLFAMAMTQPSQLAPSIKENLLRAHIKHNEFLKTSIVGNSSCLFECMDF